MSFFGERVAHNQVGWWPTIFPLRLIWLSSAIQLLGGGSEVAATMLFVIVADIAPESKRYVGPSYPLLTSAIDSFPRTHFLSIVYASILISEIIFVPIGAALTGINPWIPFLMAWLFTALGSLMVFALPETLDTKGVEADALSIENIHGEDPLTSTAILPTDLKSDIYNELSKLYNSVGFLFSDKKCAIAGTDVFRCCSVSPGDAISHHIRIQEI